MFCPHCGSDQHKVIDTRTVADTIRRRRRCTACDQRFTTYEHVAPSLLVTKSDGRREPFDRQKLLAGIRIAAAKRPISSNTIENVATQIEDALLSLNRSEVNRRDRQSGVGPSGRDRPDRLHPLCQCLFGAG